MTNTETPSKNVDNAKKLVKVLRLVARDAEDRAKAFRDYVTLLEKAVENPEEIAQIEQGWFKDPSTAFDILERIDAVCHIHSGSTEASHMRRAQGELFKLVGGKNVMGY